MDIQQFMDTMLIVLMVGMVIFTVYFFFQMKKLNCYIREQKRLEGEALYSLSKDEVREIIADWAKSKGLTITKDNVAFWYQGQILQGIKIFDDETREALKKLQM